MRLFIALLLACASGCATIAPLTLSEDPSVHRAPATSKYPDADAVYLLREQRTVMVSRWSGGSFVEFQAHDVLAILTEDGFSRANVRVEYPEKGEILDFEARTIGVDGRSAAVTDLNVHDDTSLTTDKSSYLTRIFAFPNVSVGSVLEYRYTVRVPGRMSHINDYLNADVPVERLVLEVSGTPDIRYQTKIYNTAQKWVESTEGGRWVLRWTADDIPAGKSEPHDPPKSVRNPWWVFTVLQLTKYNVAFDWNRTWASTYDGRVKSLCYDNEEYYSGFEAKLDVPDGAPALRKVTAAVDAVRTRWRNPGAGRYPGRKARELDDRGEATGFERTRVLWKLLNDRGVEALYAVTNRRDEQEGDRDVPWTGAFPSFVLYLPVQPGLPVELWLDGACDFCAVGEIPWWLQGREAMVLHSTLESGKKMPTVAPQWRAIVGPNAPDERRERRTHATIAADLSLTVVDSVRDTAGLASKTRSYVLGADAKTLDQDAEKALKSRLPSATLTRRGAPELDPSARIATRDTEGRVANYAVADGELRVVPLSMLDTDPGLDMAKATRTWPVVFPASFERSDDVQLSHPAQWTVRELPAAVRMSARGVTCSAEVKVAGPAALRVTRVLGVTGGEHPVAAYSEIRAVVQACDAFRDQAITLVATGTSSAATP